MKTKIIEVTNGPNNWGKFLIGAFDQDEYAHKSRIDELGRSLLRVRGWAPGHYLVLDLETREGAVFLLGGHARADLDKHRIWVCPLFEPFLEWLYRQVPLDLDSLPDLVDLPGVPFSLRGYRRPGR